MKLHRQMASSKRKTGKIVVDELLMFLQNKIPYLPEQPLSQICVDVFDDSSIQKSKTILFNVLNIPLRQSKSTPTRDVVEIINVLKSLDPDEATFVARDLELLPFVTYGNVDETRKERKIAVLHGTTSYNTVGYVYEDPRDPIKGKANAQTDLFIGQAVASSFTRRFSTPKPQKDRFEDENSSRHYNSWEKPQDAAPQIMPPERTTPENCNAVTIIQEKKKIIELLSRNIEKPVEKTKEEEDDENKQLMIKQRLGVDILERIHEVELMKEAAGIKNSGASKKNKHNDKPGTSKSTPNNLPAVNATDDPVEAQESANPKGVSKSKKPISNRKQKQLTTTTLFSLLANRFHSDGTLIQNTNNQSEIANMPELDLPDLDLPELDFTEDVLEVPAPVKDVNIHESASKRKKRLAKLKKKQLRAKAAMQKDMPNSVAPDSTIYENSNINNVSNCDDTVFDKTANLEQNYTDLTANLELENSNTTEQNNVEIITKEFADIGCQTDMEDHACVYKDELNALKEQLSREENIVSPYTAAQLYDIIVKKGKSKNKESTKKTKSTKDGKGKVKSPILIVPIIITNVLPNTTASDIREDIHKLIGEPVEIHKLDVAYSSRNKNTFKLFVPHTKLAALMKAHFWPEGIVFSMFDNCKLNKDRN